MDIVYFTIAAIVLYIVADKALDRIETARGKRFENRGVVFFCLLLVLALGAFALIRHLVGA